MGLREDILSGPYDLQNRDDGAIAAALSIGRERIISRPIGIGTVLDVLGPADGAAVLDGLEALGAQVPAVRWAMRLLTNGTLDVGMASVRAQIDALIGSVLTSEQAAAIKALAVVPDPVSSTDVTRALEGL